jgi:hypothetical protein
MGLGIPAFVLPIFKRTIVLTLPEWLYSAIYQPGAPRIWAESVLIFSLMVVALSQPMKSIFLVREGPEPIHRQSPKLIGGSAVTVLLIVIAVLAWIHLRVYEISPAELSGNSLRCSDGPGCEHKVQELQTLAFIAPPAAPGRWEFRRGSDRTQPPG